MSRAIELNIGFELISREQSLGGSCQDIDTKYRQHGIVDAHSDVPESQKIASEKKVHEDKEQIHHD